MYIFHSIHKMVSAIDNVFSSLQYIVAKVTVDCNCIQLKVAEFTQTIIYFWWIYNIFCYTEINNFVQNAMDDTTLSCQSLLILLKVIILLWLVYDWMFKKV